MFEMLVIAVVNLIVGGLIGVSGIAGFLLPMTFAGYLGMEVSDSLTLSFLAFLVSGVIGSYNYYRKGDLDLWFSVKIGVGSFLGALIGVRLNLLIPAQTVKILLYVVVLLSGISILARKNPKEEKEVKKENTLLGSTVIILLIGIVTGAICSLSGAGGPILVMPLLVCMGMEIRTAVAVSLFDSVFIALPAFVGYLTQCSGGKIWIYAAICVVFHAVGVIIGSENAHKIRQKPLKLSVAVFSIAIAVYMIAGAVR